MTLCPLLRFHPEQFDVLRIYRHIKQEDLTTKKIFFDRQKIRSHAKTYYFGCQPLQLHRKSKAIEEND